MSGDTRSSRQGQGCYGHLESRGQGCWKTHAMRRGPPTQEPWPPRSWVEDQGGAEGSTRIVGDVWSPCGSAPLMALPSPVLGPETLAVVTTALVS